ncbi:hypothetical protein LUZ60_006949 [Juncus effusus]|nr:hypothetical protein LUZ60_006949 [Juncus effusus]
MGKGRPRASASLPSPPPPPFSAPIPHAPVFFPSESEFQDPIRYLAQIRPLAEPFGICRIVPPETWTRPPFSLPLSSFPTKSQPIHLLQSRLSSSDPYTFKLDYSRFVTTQLQRKVPKKIVFENELLDLCALFNAVKRFGGYEVVCEEKKWADVALFVRPGKKISDCSKHVLSQLYYEHLYDYEIYNYNSGSGSKQQLEKEKEKDKLEFHTRKRRKKNREDQTTTEDLQQQKVNNGEFDQICQQCKSGLHGDVMLLCDRCDNGYHLYCLTPALESVPEGNWYCLDCMNSDQESFGFVPGKNRSLEEFKKFNEKMRKKWFGLKNINYSQIERKFWEIVEGKAGEAEVMYGSDLDTSVFGSGFPKSGKPNPESGNQNPGIGSPDLWRRHVESPWNLNNFPKLEGSILRIVRENIAGVMVPWLYIGMLFSAFCWHVEDHCFYSINYLHWGEPKCWYGVPGSAAEAFEQVMRKALPDLFDTQPDLLFQLVTMLNPSVFQENKVPVYKVIQEPGNFVITFPRSYHGGFNMGLNCAEAVNFATADWLPHGGTGASLYKRFHKSCVLSHEELLCVLAKIPSSFDNERMPYLKGELERIVEKERKQREEVWRSGVVRSAVMSAKRGGDDFIGAEEDPTCIICQQYLYLSAVGCKCRPDSLVCTEHWRHICECDPGKREFYYRHSLAQLCDLVLRLENNDSCSLGVLMIDSESSPQLAKQVNGNIISFNQLADDWLSNANKILEIPFVQSNYDSALVETEQFLWADHHMDSVRDLVGKLKEAKKWSLCVKGCMSKIKYLENSENKNSDNKVAFNELAELVSVDSVPCCLPDFDELKKYNEVANKLIEEIKSALCSGLNIAELELLYLRAVNFPICLKETTILLTEISSAKVLLQNALYFLEEKKPDSIEIDHLNQLKTKMKQINVRIPEMDMVLDLCKEAESWKFKCEELLKGPIKLKDLEEFLQTASNLIFSISELKLLRKYHTDAKYWNNNANDLMQSLSKRTDFANVVSELLSVLKSGESLRVKVDELSNVEAELKRSMCRQKASEALNSSLPVETIQQIFTESTLLEINEEQLFIDISIVIQQANSWVERARFILDNSAPLSEFEDLIKSSEGIIAILPPLSEIKEAVFITNAWLDKSQPFINRSKEACDGLLQVTKLKELIAESKNIKATTNIPSKLLNLLEESELWIKTALNLLQESECFFGLNDKNCKIDPVLFEKCEGLVCKIDELAESGSALGFDFEELPQLKNKGLIAKWIFKALSFCFQVPSSKEVEELLEELDQNHDIILSGNLATRLIKGINWLKRALAAFPNPKISERCSLKDVESILSEYQEELVPYPIVVLQLQNAVKKHRRWVEQCRAFFMFPGQKSWTVLLKLKESSQSDAFSCRETDELDSEFEKVNKWVRKCNEIMRPFLGEFVSLSTELEKIKRSLDKALCLYNRSSCMKQNKLCVCCPSDSDKEKSFQCPLCGDWYHISCVGSDFTVQDTDLLTCQFCLYLKNGDISESATKALICKGTRPEFRSFVELTSVAKGPYTGVKELDLIQEIVREAKHCKSCLMQIVNKANLYHEKDLSPISQSLLIALKAVAVAGIYSEQETLNIELVIAKYSWKTKMNKLLSEPKKPSMEQILCLDKEGSDLEISCEDHFMREMTKMKQISLDWQDRAKKVISDSGELPLNHVYDLISEGENLPVQLESELKLLRERSVLYCICRKPYNENEDMIACDMCDEWYHFKCIDFCAPIPDKFFCFACQPSKPSDHSSKGRQADKKHQASKNKKKRLQIKKRVLKKKLHLQERVDLIGYLKCYSEMHGLWIANKKPFRRIAKRRTNLKYSYSLDHWMSNGCNVMLRNNKGFGEEEEMSKKNNLKTRRNQHEFDLRREKEDREKKEKKLQAKKSKMKVDGSNVKRKKSNFKVGKKVKTKLSALTKAKAEQAMQID